jgi:hydrogenase maturation protease
MPAGLRESRSRAVIFGCGNPSRGDDALGPALMDRAEQFIDGRPFRVRIDLIQDFQLQIEHALDLQGACLALFLDASATAKAPYTFTRLTSAQDPGWSTHELSPASLLRVFEQLQLGAAPPSYLLSVRGERFQLGENLAPRALENRVLPVGVRELTC